MRIGRTTIPITMALAGAFFLGAVSPSEAQPPRTILAQNQAPGAQQSLEVKEEDLKSYAMAAVEVNRISSAWQPRISAAENQQEAEEMRNQATQQMIKAIEATGLSVREYNQIYNLAQEDPEIRETVDKHLDNAR